MIVKKAIQSINHDPILFEKIGARPHTPRALYKARLEDSQIFVGIYKESYGWVAPDMTISGVEDEFQIASARKIARLIYVYKSTTARDPRLESLIETAKNSGLTYYSYSDPKELREAIRRDVTAVVSGRFVEQAVISNDAPNPEELLDSVLPNRTHRFRRPQIESKLLAAQRENRRIVVTAPLGSGKTVMLAQLSLEHNWVFVDAQGLNGLDLLARVANVLRKRLGQEAATLMTEHSAAQEIANACEKLTNVVLAIDSPDDPLTLWNLPDRNYGLVLSTRSALQVPSKQRFDIPSLNKEEITHWVTGLQGAQPESSEVSSLAELSRGNPLYLRFYALGGNPSSDLSLQDLEIRAVQSLPPTSREITSYLALSSRPLSLEDLRLLVDPEQSPEFVAQQISTASGLVRQTRRHVQLVHEHLRETIVDQLRDSPTRLDFFANRLGRYFEHTGRYVAAFKIYLEAGEQRHADRLLDQAGQQAGFMGGGAPAIPIFRRKAELAHTLGQFREEIHAQLSLAYACYQTGARSDALHALREARTLAIELKDETQIIRVKEVAALLELANSPRNQRVGELEAVRKAYEAVGDPFDAARVGTLLAAEYLAQRDFVTAETISRELQDYFTGIGDDYGVRVTRLNLASALSGMNGRETEAAAVLQQLHLDLDPDDYPRERAALCNFLTRHYRYAGDTEQAADFALEAIRIGEQLNDRHLIAINRINLGNVRRDEARFDQALEEYRNAEQAALLGGGKEDEAWANELIASIFNEQQQFDRASIHAEHAATLAQQIGDAVLIARTEEERAIAFKGRREFDVAIDAYIVAAKAIANFRPEAPYFVSLVTHALSLCAKSRRIDLKIRFLTNVFGPDLGQLGRDNGIDPVRALCAVLPSIAKTINAERLLPIVALAVGDLLTDAPPVVERRIILQIAEELIGSNGEIDSASLLMTVVGILMAHSGNCLNLGDVVNLAERLSKSSPDAHFKPQSDGAAHWTLRLNIADVVIVTVTQLDDDPKIAVTTMIVAILLKALDREIRRSLIDAENASRREVAINVVSRKELETQLGSDTVPNLGDMPDRFSIAESTDFARSDQPPIVLICGDSFGNPWKPEERPFSDSMVMLTQLLRVFTSHLLGKAVEPDVLFPKISALIRKIGFRGSDDEEG